MPRVLVTGASGRIGRVLRTGLRDLSLDFRGHADLDVLDQSRLREAFASVECVIHLATPIRGNAASLEELTDSVRMARDVLRVARDQGVGRVVLPSSFRVVSEEQLQGVETVTLGTARPARGEYGRTRLLIEELGKEAAAAGLDVICVRLGSVRHPDAPLNRRGWVAHWLSHEDCVAVFRRCIETPMSPGRFAVFFAVSDTKRRILETTNPIGWSPATRSVGAGRRIRAAWHRLNTGVRGRLRLRTRLRKLLT